ncbi:hypothetical protein GB928_004265 [Shinella curvata]|uniref:Uncharacterized protein n=1 Tax=Shinella curvata TaxID=1817964 RepID=A0ABT8X9H3_9HYPH|nr:hypothetical protein [Shinella curvata]MCJ8051662.1 hypothetical protein [Shinella curvata]MDO6120390.1 hypothetical protein [Shinella curvata]
MMLHSEHSTANLPTAVIDANVSRIITTGHTLAGDGGHAALVRDAAGPIVTLDGAKWRIASSPVNPLMFGAKGDAPLDGSAGGTDDRSAIQAAWNHAAKYRVPCEMLGRGYNCSERLWTQSNLCIRADFAVLYITEWPTAGGFLGNWNPNAEDRVQSNVYIERLITDGSKLPPPTSTQNTNLGPEFTFGMRDARIVGCVARKAPKGNGAGVGGCGFGGERGLDNVIFENCIAEDCYRGVRVAGLSGVNDNGTSRAATGLVFRNTTIRRSGCALHLHAMTEDASIMNLNDLGLFDVTFDGIDIVDCGHVGWASFDFGAHSPILPQKSGVFVISGARNVIIKDVTIKLKSTYTTTDEDWQGHAGYPGSGNYISAGLSGAVGAIVWGWGSNIVIDKLMLDGDVDAVYHHARGVAMGDLGSISVTAAPAPVNNHGVDITRVRNAKGTVGAMIDCMAGTVLSRVSGEVFGKFVTPPTALIKAGSPFVAATNILVGVREMNGIKEVIGSAKQLYDAGNTFASFPSGRTDIRRLALSGADTRIRLALADDVAGSAELPNATCLLWLVSSSSTAANALLAIHNGGVWISGQQGTGLEKGSGPLLNAALANGEGTDGKLTVSCNGGRLYVSNRLGSAGTFDFHIVASPYG